MTFLEIKIKESLSIALAQGFTYTLLAINVRALSQGDYYIVALSDILLASSQYFVIRKISSASETLHQWVGYTIGSVVGSLLGVWVSINHA